MNALAKILNGDAIEMLRTLPDQSVHTCVTSPPYWALRDYGVAGQIGLEPTVPEFLERMVAVFREVHRVLRDDGTCWVNLGDMAATGQPPSPSRYITHRGHLLSTADNWGGPMRSLIFWWLLSMMGRDWWARFLDRYGAPFVVGKYDQGDDTSRTILERAFSYSMKVGGLVVSKETEVDIKQAAATDSGEAYKSFIELCNREKSKLILGETLSSDAQAGGGMNSGNAELQGDKRSDKRQSDARRLGATLRTQLFEQYLAINGFTGRAPLAIWGSVSVSEQSSLGLVFKNLADAGLRPTDDALDTISERFGFPIERAPAAPSPVGPGLTPFSAPGWKGSMATHPADVIAEAGAAALVKGFRGDLAPIREIIITAKTPDEAIRGVEAFCARLDPSRSVRVLEEALIAIAATGAAAAAR